jgi:uncharacterized protein DUF4157
LLAELAERDDVSNSSFCPAAPVRTAARALRRRPAVAAIEPEIGRGGRAPPDAAAANRFAPDYGMSLARVPVHAGPQRAPLRISSPGDRAERDADGAADRVMRGERVRLASVSDAGISRAAEGGAAAAGGGAAAAAAALSGSGRPLDSAMRSGFESRFGTSFAGVRIHADAAADGGARAIRARAFTLGGRIGFAAGAYAPGTPAGQRLLAHELAHVAQGEAAGGPVLRRSVEGAPAPAPGPTAGAPGGPAAGPAPGPKADKPAKAERLSVDVLSAVDPEDFLVKAAADTLGADIRVSSMNDMVDQLAGLAGPGKCIERIRVFNHGNAYRQEVVRGAKNKAGGKDARFGGDGFSLTWLLDEANQAQLGKLRGTLCCGAALNWYGCSTAGVWAEGGKRTDKEQEEDKKRYQGVYADWYHSVDEALAHGATEFKAVGLENVQSWSNALCAKVSAATDFNNWKTSLFGSVSRTVIHGGSEVSYRPQDDVACPCEPSGKLGGSAQSGERLRKNAEYLRNYFLAPARNKATGLLGREQKEQPAETAPEKATREKAEAAEAAATQARGTKMKESVLTKAGFAGGAAPATADEALRVTAAWGLDLAKFISKLPVQTAATAQKTIGHHTETSLRDAQTAAIAALSHKERETFMSALLLVQQESFWRNYLATHNVFIIPDVTGTNYGGYTQTGTGRDGSGRPIHSYAIHMSIELMKIGNPNRVAATIVHELSHQIDAPSSTPALQPFLGELATLIASHPDIVALRAGAPDAAEAEARQLRSINQMLYEATTRAEDEMFVHLQQLTHQPEMRVRGNMVRGSDYIIALVEGFVRQLRKIGFPRATENQLLVGIMKRAMALYDRRIAAAPEGSPEREKLDINKRMAALALQEAIRFADEPPSAP